MIPEAFRSLSTVGNQRATQTYPKIARLLRKALEHFSATHLNDSQGDLSGIESYTFEAPISYVKCYSNVSCQENQEQSCTTIISMDTSLPQY